MKKRMLIRLKHSFNHRYCFLSGCSNVFNKSSADWAFGFVVWDGYIYQLSDEYVDEIR